MNKILGLNGVPPLVCAAAAAGRRVLDAARATDPAAAPDNSSRRVTLVCSGIFRLPMMCVWVLLTVCIRGRPLASVLLRTVVVISPPWAGGDIILALPPTEPIGEPLTSLT